MTKNCGYLDLVRFLKDFGIFRPILQEMCVNLAVLLFIRQMDKIFWKIIYCKK